MRIALFGDDPQFPTGYGGQNRQLALRLAERGHDTAVFAIQHVVRPGLNPDGVLVYPGSDTHAVRRSLKEFRPDVLIHNLDSWALLKNQRTYRPMLPAVRAHRGQDKGACALIYYSPVDGDMYPPNFIASWAECDLGLTTTKWGRDVLLRHGVKPDQVQVLYPGIDVDVYRPDGEASRKPFDLPEENPLVLSVGTNLLERKMFPLVMLAFRKYLERYDADAILYLHTPEGHFKLEEFVRPLGLEGKMWARDAKGGAALTYGMTDLEMAALYRSSACLVNLANREGFDSPSAEAASCGTPVVVSDMPIRHELKGLGKGRWRYLPTKTHQWFPLAYTLAWIADPDEAADTMGRAVKVRAKGGVPPELTWQAAAEQLEGFCAEAYERMKTRPKDPTPAKEDDDE